MSELPELDFDVWLDFHDVEFDEHDEPIGHAVSSLRFAKRQVANLVFVGDTVRVGDGEGNRCWARVTGFRDGLVELDVRMDTWQSDGEVAS